MAVKTMDQIKQVAGIFGLMGLLLLFALVCIALFFGCIWAIKTVWYMV
jgi:hypothetical protein